MFASTQDNSWKLGDSSIFFLAQTYKFFVSARPDGPDQK